MSVYLLSDAELSAIAYFAQASGLGRAQAVADSLRQSNLVAYNQKYQANECFKTVSLSSEIKATAQRVFVLMGDFTRNSAYGLIQRKNEGKEDPLTPLFDAIAQATYFPPQDNQSFDIGEGIVIGSAVTRQERGYNISAGYVVDFNRHAPSIYHAIGDSGLTPVHRSGQMAIVVYYDNTRRDFYLRFFPVEELNLDANLKPLSIEQAMGVKKHINNRKLQKVTAPAQQPLQQTPLETDDITITLALNDARNGIALTFSDKPAAETITGLKSHQFRWSKRGFWYAKQTPLRMEFAKSLVTSSVNI
jgi:hypothetical protein